MIPLGPELYLRGDWLVSGGLFAFMVFSVSFDRRVI